MEGRKRFRRWAVPGGLAVLLVVLTACGPEVTDESCEAQEDGGAKYTFTIENGEDKDITFQWIVKDDPDDKMFNRHGEEISLDVDGSITKTVTVGKNDNGKRVQIFWPAPGGDDTGKLNKVLKATCP